MALPSWLGPALGIGSSLFGSSEELRLGKAQASSLYAQASEVDEQRQFERIQAQIDAANRMEAYKRISSTALSNMATSGLGLSSGSFITASLNMADDLAKQQGQASRVSKIRQSQMRRQASRLRRSAREAKKASKKRAGGGLLGSIGKLFGK